MSILASFAPGDEVRLKSGGPIMTIASVEDGKALCMWFDGTKQFEKEYPFAVLIAKRDIPPRMSMGRISTI